MSETNKTGCWSCVYLDWYEKECYECNEESGYVCDFREPDDIEKFKTFPCNRKLKCFFSVDV